MTGVTVYADISGKPNDSAMVAACYIGNLLDWLSIEREWREMLRDAGVQHFHSTDFYACQGEFKGWNRGSPEHKALAERVRDMPFQHNLKGFACGMQPQAFVSILRPELDRIDAPQRPVSPRAFLLTSCLIHVSAILLPQFPKGVRAYVLTDQEQGIGDAISYFKFCQRNDEPWTRVFWNMSTGDMRGSLPLQVADVLAYLTWKNAAAWMPNPAQPAHESFRRLHRDVRFYVMNEDEMRANAPAFRAFVEANPDGLTRPRRRGRPRTGDLSAAPPEDGHHSRPSS